MSPRLQRILLVLLQEVLVKYHHVPELPGLKEELDMEMENLSTSSSDPKILLFLDYLLHLSSHADSCVGALVNEKSPCAICCPLRHAFFYLSETSGDGRFDPALCLSNIVSTVDSSARPCCQLLSV